MMKTHTWRIKSKEFLTEWDSFDKPKEKPLCKKVEKPCIGQPIELTNEKEYHSCGFLGEQLEHRGNEKSVKILLLMTFLCPSLN